MIPKSLKYYATFGSSQLPNFDIDPMTIALYIPSAEEHTLRLALQQPPFNNKYCTTYDVLSLTDMINKYNLVPITIKELLILLDD